MMRTLILGFDSFDPVVFERLAERGSLPNLTKIAETGGYSRFSVSNPPQSEVSWTSMATGLNPGGHGIFDFVHRNPSTYHPTVSLLPTKSGLGGTQFVPPITVETIFDFAVRQGYPATVLWWPATFPARPESPVRTLPGLGTPDILGRLGVGTVFTSESGLTSENHKTKVALFQQTGKNRFAGELTGPIRKNRRKNQESCVRVDLEIIGEKSARLYYGSSRTDLQVGVWSPILEVVFDFGLFYKVHALTRAILTKISPEINLYLLPLQIHPLKSFWRYASPQNFVKDIWQNCGPFLTIGWPQDTTALEEGWINDQQFLDLCESIFNIREKIFFYQLQHFREGILASVFDSLDRIQHMFWRDRQDIVEEWYIKLDAMVGRVISLSNSHGSESAKTMIVSDHGFANFDHKVHLNRWLIDQRYLTSAVGTPRGGLKDVDWSQSKAYAIGLNSIYLNLADREKQGIVKPDEVLSLSQEICQQLQTWTGPDRQPVVRRAYTREEALNGSLTSYGPDILVGFSPGYRASQQTGLGEWTDASLEPNKDHWRADHCIDPVAVPGTLFADRGLRDLPSPSYLDFPHITVGEKFTANRSAPPPSQDDQEDQKIIEERLKSLGYL